MGTCTACRNIESVARRDGQSAARAYAQQMIVQYRRCVLERKGLIVRKLMIEAYICAKRWLRNDH